MTPGAMPRVRLRPRKGQRCLAGHPWLYKDELVLDRRTRALNPGTVAVLEDHERAAVALVAVNPEGAIPVRVLDRDARASIDSDWIGARLSRALALREVLFDEPFYRLCHAEGDGLPGLVVDRLGDTLVVQPNTAWAESALTGILSALDAHLSPTSVIVNRDSRGRAQEGLEGGRTLVRGSADRIPVRMNGAIHLADPMSGQKTGVYFDQRPNHAFAAGLGRGGRVLDVFAHTGGFALSCLAAGAQSALAVDSSEPALALAADAARLNGFELLETRRGDAVKTMMELAERGERFDLVICDPPAFAPSKQALAAGLRAYERVAKHAVPAVAPNGYLVLCSCSHAVSAGELHAAAARAFRAAGRRARLLHLGRAGPDHPIHPALPESGYLKALFYALD